MAAKIEAQVLTVKHNGEGPVVVVGFFSGEDKLGEKTYYLKPDQTVDDIKPQIVDDLEDFKKTVEKTDSLKSLENTKVNLAGVKSARETRAEETAARDAARKAAEEEAKKSKQQ